jgi:hypothetical protein
MKFWTYMISCKQKKFTGLELVLTPWAGSEKKNWNGPFLPFAPQTSDNTLRLCSMYYLQYIVKSGVIFPSKISRIEIGFQI